MKLVTACTVAALIAACAMAADSVKDLSGTWRVTGEGISGEVRLPGTLAAYMIIPSLVRRDYCIPIAAKVNFNPKFRQCTVLII